MSDQADEWLKERGKRLQRLREDRGLTQDQAAQQLGVHRVTLSRIENGETEGIRLEMAQLMEALYGPEVADILGEISYTRSDPVSRETPVLAVREREDSGETIYGMRRLLAPRAYEHVYRYLSRMAEAGLPSEMISEAERLFADPRYAQLYSGRRELTEAEQIQVVEATWKFLRDVIRISEGIDLR